jgi:hypothetical protein
MIIHCLRWELSYKKMDNANFTWMSLRYAGNSTVYIISGSVTYHVCAIGKSFFLKFSSFS